MKMKCILRSQVSVLVALLFVAAPLLAGERYLASNQLDAIVLLTPPPVPDSVEQAADLASTRAVFKARTREEKKRAEKDSNLSIYNFAPAIGEFFVRGKFPKT